MTSRVTIKSINSTISARGSDFVLNKGNGYFYFTSPTHDLYDSTVCTNRLGSLTVNQWINELIFKIEETNSRSRSIRDIPSLKD